jgi:hypothetical protein
LGIRCGSPLSVSVFSRALDIASRLRRTERDVALNGVVKSLLRLLRARRDSVLGAGDRLCERAEGACGGF